MLCDTPLDRVIGVSRFVTSQRSANTEIRSALFSQSHFPYFHYILIFHSPNNKKSLHCHDMGITILVIMSEFEVKPDSGASPSRQRTRLVQIQTPKGMLLPMQRYMRYT